jgi:hypothetical protein
MDDPFDEVPGKSNPFQIQSTIGTRYLQKPRIQKALQIIQY